MVPHVRAYSALTLDHHPPSARSAVIQTASAAKVPQGRQKKAPHVSAGRSRTNQESPFRDDTPMSIHSTTGSSTYDAIPGEQYTRCVAFTKSPAAAL